MTLNYKVVSKITIQLKYILASFFIFWTISLSAQFVTTESMEKVGEGTMSWMFIDIYQATLFTRNGSYQASHFPQALSITYLKDIKKNHLLTATKNQWLSQGYTQDKVNKWLAVLAKIWPDIQQQDNLTFYVINNNKATFFYNQREIGNINDGDLSAAFLAIWLSDKTSQPKLRRQLLGI